MDPRRPTREALARELRTTDDLLRELREHRAHLQQQIDELDAERAHPGDHERARLRLRLVAGGR